VLRGNGLLPRKHKFPIFRPTYTLRKEAIPSIPTIIDSWEWYGTGFVLHSNLLGPVTLLCFDLPQKALPFIQSTISLQATHDMSLYSMLLIVLSETIKLYDESVWSIGNRVCNFEVVSQIYHH
jgi:hypothetical protein